MNVTKKMVALVAIFAFGLTANAQNEKSENKEVVKAVKVNDSTVVRIYKDGSSKTFRIKRLSEVSYEDKKAFLDGRKKSENKVVKSMKVNDSTVVRVYEDGSTKTFRIKHLSEVSYEDKKAFLDGRKEIVSLREEEYNGKRTTHINFGLGAEGMLYNSSIAPMFRAFAEYECKWFIVAPHFAIGTAKLDENATIGAGSTYWRMGLGGSATVKLLCDRNHGSFLGIYGLFEYIWNKTDDEAAEDRSSVSATKFAFGIEGRYMFNTHWGIGANLGLGNEGSFGHNDHRTNTLHPVAGAKVIYNL